jgi:D-alanyl-D-alanine carboxypeptidase (penicillin-binding protein 5/6)
VRRRRSGWQALAGAALATALAVAPAAAAGAAPSTTPPAPSAAPASALPPSADPSLPTPSEPVPGLPPQGSAPDGSTVGGPRLSTRAVVVAPGTPALPREVVAAGWLVADAGSGEVLAARDPHGRYYPASTLKLLTLLTVGPALDPAEVVEGTVEDESVEGSRVGLVQRGRYPVGLLVQALILQSGNDAANALARAFGGLDATVRAMGDVAADLGAFDTVVGTPSGLDVAGQSSSPYDLALFLRAVLEDPGLAPVLTVRTAQMPRVKGRSPGYQIQNENPLLDDPGNLGGKTGFTDAARHTFVTAAERGGRRLVVSVMRTESRPLRAAQQAALLLDWGFSVPEGTRGVGRLVDPGEVPEDPPPPVETSAAPTAGTSAAPTSAAPSLAAAAPPAGDDGGSALPAVATVAAAAGLVAAGVGLRRLRRRPAPPPPPGAAAAAPPGGTPSTPS